MNVIDTLHRNATGIEVLRILFGAFALYYSTAVLIRARRYYVRRRELPRDAQDDPDEDADFLAVDFRLEMILVACSAFFLLSGAVAAFTPPPRGQGPNNLAGFVTGIAALLVSISIVAVKIRNRAARGRIFRRAETRLSMTMERARDITKVERHGLKSDVAVLEAQREILERENEDLTAANARLAAKLRRVGVDPGADAPPLADL